MNPSSINRMYAVQETVQEPRGFILSVAGASRRRPEGRVFSQVPTPMTAKTAPLQRMVARSVRKKSDTVTIQCVQQTIQEHRQSHRSHRGTKTKINTTVCPFHQATRINGAVHTPDKPWRRKGRSIIAAVPVQPNTSLKLSTNGMPPGPGHRYGVHFLWPGPGGTPLAPA
jgi:hypothetical protein